MGLLSSSFVRLVGLVLVWIHTGRDSSGRVVGVCWNSDDSYCSILVRLTLCNIIDYVIICDLMRLVIKLTLMLLSSHYNTNVIKLTL